MHLTSSLGLGARCTHGWSLTGTVRQVQEWPGLIQPPLPSLPSPLLHMSGKLSMAELQSYFEYSESRLGSQPPLAERYAALSAAVSSKPDGSQMADFEEFVDLVRAQVAASEGSKGWVVSQVGAGSTPRRWGRTTHL